ncbi:predicted protein [Chaetoceros tenuissimus]|uniref:Chromo domain-containing protein n=1 Tax=Chaetoceros tenuissimus TaxID=426638 RepID=A0AAD3CKQ3_9STRA|nr:predicted protein [Chaetoceros tenuissimus]
MQGVKAEEIPSDSPIEQLPEILTRKKIKIRGNIYTLDRDIEEDNTTSVEKQNNTGDKIEHQEEPIAKKVKTEGKREDEYFLEIKWERYEDSDDGSWKETPYSMFADDMEKFEHSRIFSEKEGAEMGEEF